MSHAITTEVFNQNQNEEDKNNTHENFHHMRKSEIKIDSKIADMVETDFTGNLYTSRRLVSYHIIQGFLEEIKKKRNLGKERNKKREIEEKKRKVSSKLKALNSFSNGSISVSRKALSKSKTKSAGRNDGSGNIELEDL